MKSPPNPRPPGDRRAQHQERERVVKQTVLEIERAMSDGDRESFTLARVDRKNLTPGMWKKIDVALVNRFATSLDAHGLHVSRYPSEVRKRKNTDTRRRR